MIRVSSHYYSTRNSICEIAFPFTKKIVYSYIIGYAAIRPLNTLGAKYRNYTRAQSPFKWTTSMHTRTFKLHYGSPHKWKV